MDLRTAPALRNGSPHAARQQLQPRALYEAIADRVRDRILSHDLKPGTAVNEMDLVQAYGVSRTPVREALKVLHHEGLLTAQNRRGMVVTVVKPYELEEARGLYLLLRTHVHSKGDRLPEPCPAPLRQRLLQLVERQLRLAHGPAFEQEMQCMETSA